jgi:hypothetical protein
MQNKGGAVMARRLTLGIVCAMAVSIGTSGVARADAATATVTPATGGNGVPLVFGHAAFDLATVGYTQSEFFIQGSASAHTPVAPLTNDGKWNVAQFSPAAYKSRLVVNRPINAKKFNGSVVVEWFNVSGGADASPEWQHTHVELLRKGYVWVGVSAQAVGLNQLKCAAPGPGCPAAGDPVRYASLAHPGDSYSYDIYSQVGQAVWDQAQLVLGGLKPKRVIAAGESQSAGRLVTYINAAHPLVEVYDGFLIHSRGAGGAALSQAPLAAVPTPVPTFIRDDIDEPTIVFAAENDAGSFVARQDDNARYRLWEVAGTAHFDQYGLVQAQNDTGNFQTYVDWFDTMRNPTSNPSPNFSCAVPINTGPSTFIMRAAVRYLNRWIQIGAPPPQAPRLQTVTVTPLVYQVDEFGNVLGGIRTPAVDARVARLNGLGQPPGGLNQFCFLFGITVPLTEEQLEATYMDHVHFAVEWTVATFEAMADGFVLPEDGFAIWIAGVLSDVLK